MQKGRRHQSWRRVSGGVLELCTIQAMLFKSQLRLLRMINSWEQVAYNHLEQAELKEDIWDVLPEIQDLPRVLGSCWMVKWAMWHVVLQFYCSNFITIQLVSIVYTENDTFKCMSILTILVVWIFKYPCIHIWYICMHIYIHTHTTGIHSLHIPWSASLQSYCRGCGLRQGCSESSLGSTTTGGSWVSFADDMGKLEVKAALASVLFTQFLNP